MKKIILFVSATSLLIGCQAMPYKPYARNVKLSPKKGGVVAMNTEYRDEDRDKASSIMKRNCLGEYDILEEGEVITGTTTSSNTDNYKRSNHKVGSIFGLPVVNSGGQGSNSRATTVQNKEWQIRYKCLNVAKGKSKKRVR